MAESKNASAQGRHIQPKTLASFLASDREKHLLRALICGGDDGKSTLIDRLLHDCQSVFEDRVLAGQPDGEGAGFIGGEANPVRVVDRPRAKLEPAKNTNVAYRYFATAKRKFVVGDTSGDEQHFRTMTACASKSDVAIVLVDACKDLHPQAYSQSFVVSLLGIRHVVLVVNKMDLVDYSEERFAAQAGAYSDFATALSLEDVVCIPVSALKGENVTRPSPVMQWYQGPNLLAYLETVDIGDCIAEEPFRFPVQWVNRTKKNFCGYAGTIVSGSVRPGDEIAILPSGQEAKVTRIVTMDGDLDHAASEEAVTMTLDTAFDVSRGDVLAAPKVRPKVADQFAAHIIWFSGNELLPGRSYYLECGGQLTRASVSSLKYKINPESLDHIAGRSLANGEIAFCNISTERPIIFDPYRENRRMGGFTLSDTLTNAIVGAGVIAFDLRRATNIRWQSLDIGKPERAAQKKQKPCCLWFTGLSGSGKSTIANLLEKKLHANGCHTYILDGDNVRHGLNRDLGFTDADRVENIRRIAETAKLFVDAGLIVMVSFISPFKSERRMARELFENREFLEIWVDTPLEICEQRDAKGLYKKARAGQIKNFTGIDSAYEIPENAELRLPAGENSPEQLVGRLMDYLEMQKMV